jgi:hypothetical protein
MPTFESNNKYFENETTICANTNDLLSKSYKNIRPTRAKLALAVLILSIVSLVLALHTLSNAQTQVRSNQYFKL